MAAQMIDCQSWITHAQHAAQYTYRLTPHSMSHWLFTRASRTTTLCQRLTKPRMRPSRPTENVWRLLVLWVQRCRRSIKVTLIQLWFHVSLSLMSNIYSFIDVCLTWWKNPGPISWLSFEWKNQAGDHFRCQKEESPGWKWGDRFVNTLLLKY